jgi:hypothetical protein
LPWEVPEPRMILNFLHTCPSQPLHRFPLQQLVSKISCLNTPSIRYISLRNNNLLLFYLLFNLLSRFTKIGPFSHHNFVDDDTQSVVIYFIPMVMMEHDFRSHISRSTRCIFTVIWPQMFGDS